MKNRRLKISGKTVSASMREKKERHQDGNQEVALYPLKSAGRRRVVDKKKGKGGGGRKRKKVLP